MFGFDMFEMHEVTFEIYIEDKLTNKQTMQAPREMLMANFIQTVKQISSDKRPIKIKMLKPETIWDRNEKKQITLTNEIVFNNNAMNIWEENNQKEI